MKVKLILLISIFFASLLYAGNIDDDKGKGLHLGEEQYFETTGDFTITAVVVKDAVQINIPSMEAEKFVIYRSLMENGLYKKAGLTKENRFFDDKVDKGVNYYYVAAAIIKDENKDKDINRGIKRVKGRDNDKDKDDKDKDKDKDEKDKDKKNILISNKIKACVEIQEIISDVEVNFNTIPNQAIVIINNENIGQTPVSGKFKVGVYELTIQKPGYKTYKDYKFNVDYKKKIDVNATLEKIRSSINITTLPSGADIKVNKILAGKSPLRKEGLDLGSYEIEAGLEDYKPVKRAVILDSETPASIEIIFEKERILGSADINSIPPGADIFIDNIPYGKTPGQVKNIDAGLHALVLKKKDYNDLNKDIEIEKDKTKTYTFSLLKESGFLSVITFPDLAECFIDDILIGKTPLVGLKVDKGAYNLSIKKDSYADYREVIKVDVGENIRRDIILSMKKSTLIINTIPEKAKVLINGLNYGFTPFVSDSLQPGDLTIIITKDGFEPVNKVMSFSPGSKEDISFKLKAIEVPPPVITPAPVPATPQPTPISITPQPTPTPVPVTPVPTPAPITPPPVPTPVPVIPQAPVIKPGTLAVFAVPTGADVIINNSLMGQTPLMLSLQPGYYNVTVKKEKFQNWTINLAVESEKVRELMVNLVPLEAYLSIYSVPSYAELLLNNANYGKTPIQRIKMPAGDYVLNLKLSGYEPFSAGLNIQGTEGEVSRSYTLKKEIKKTVFESFPGGAEAAINNKIMGVTPFEYIDIKDGTYNLKFYKAGYRMWENNIMFRAGEPSVVSAKLEALRGSLLVNSDPVSCELYVDNSRVGGTGLKIDNIFAGFHDIKVVKEGYYDFGTRIKILDNKLTTHSVQLIEKPKGNLQIDSTPMAAKLYINNQFKGSTPVFIEKIPEGNYKLRITAKGYKSFNTTIAVYGNRTEYVNARLVPGSDCCCGNSLLTKPAFWYITSAVCLAGAGYSWSAENKALKNKDGKKRSDFHITRNALAVSSGASLLIGITFAIAK